MRRPATIVMLLVGALALTAIPALAGDWAIGGEYAESCSCTVPCPCLFGSAPSKGHCDVNNYLEIKKGHLVDVSVDGVTLSITGRLGSWAKFFFSEGTTDEQAKAAIELMQKPEVFGKYLPKDIEYLPYEITSNMSIERGEGTVKFSTPASTVEMTAMAGLDGTPIEIKNFGMEVMEGHQQYKSTINSHKSGHAEFSYTESNALTSTFEISGE